jgi:hypothetical protein
MSIKSADELNAYYAKDYKKLNRLIRKLKFDLGYCLHQSDDTTLDDLLDASWEFRPMLGDFRFITRCSTSTFATSLRRGSASNEKEHAEYMAKRSANVVDFAPPIARQPSAEPAPLPPTG